MITEAQKEELGNEGYAVENMEAEWGCGFAGQYRWINGDDYGVIQYSEEQAWADAVQIAPKLAAYRLAEAIEEGVA